MEDPKVPEIIDDTEFLFRGVHPNQLDPDSNLPSSIAFKDKNGVSVDRNYTRSDSECINRLLEKNNYEFILKVSALNVRNTGALLKCQKVPGNPYHCLIHDSESRIRMDTKAKAIRQRCIMVYPNTQILQ